MIFSDCDFFSFSFPFLQVAQVLLTLPYSFSQLGMVSGILLQLFYGIVGSWTAYLISVLYVEYRTRKEKENVSFKNHVIQVHTFSMLLPRNPFQSIPVVGNSPRKWIPWNMVSFPLPSLCLFIYLGNVLCSGLKCWTGYWGRTGKPSDWLSTALSSSLGPSFS